LIMPDIFEGGETDEQPYTVRDVIVENLPTERVLLPDSNPKQIVEKETDIATSLAIKARQRLILED
jgi:hypothetical protein